MQIKGYLKVACLKYIIHYNNIYISFVYLLCIGDVYMGKEKSVNVGKEKEVKSKKHYIILNDAEYDKLKSKHEVETIKGIKIAILR